MEVRNREALINDLAHSVAISNGLAFLVGARLIEYHDFSYIVSEQSVQTGQLSDKIGQMLHNLMIFSVPYENLMQCLRPSMTSTFFQEAIRIIADFVSRILRFQPLAHLIAIYKAIIKLYCDILGQYDPNFSRGAFDQDLGIQDRFLTNIITTFVEQRFGFPMQHPQFIPSHGPLSLSNASEKDFSLQPANHELWQAQAYGITPKYTPIDQVYNQRLSRPTSHSNSRLSPGVRFASGDSSNSHLSVSHLAPPRAALRSNSAQKYIPRARSSTTYVPQNLNYQYAVAQGIEPTSERDEADRRIRRESQDHTLDTAQSWLDKCTAELVLEKNENQKQLLYDQFILMIEDTLKKLKSFKVDTRNTTSEDVDTLLIKVTKEGSKRSFASMPDAILQEENARLKLQIRELETTTAEMSKKYKEKELACEELNESLRREKQETLEHVRSFQLKQSAAEEDVARQKQVIKELETRLEAYKDNLVDYEAKMSNLSIGMRTAQHELTLYSEEKESQSRLLESRTAENKVLLEELVSKREELASLREELAMQKIFVTQHSDTAANLKSTLAVSELTVQSKEKELAEIKQLYDDLLCKHTSLKAQTNVLDQNQFEKLAKDNEDLMKDKQELSTTLVTLRAELQQYILDKARLEQKLQENTKTPNDLPAQASSLQNRPPQPTMTVVHRDQSKEEKAEDQQDTSGVELTKESSQLKLRVLSLERKCSDLTEENDILIRALNQSEAQAKDLGRQLADLTATNTGLSQQLEVTVLSLNSLQNEMNALRENQIRQAQKSSGELADAEEKIKMAKTLERKLANMEADSKTEKALLQKQTKDLTEAHTEALSIIEALKKENKDLRSDLNMLTETTRHGTQQIERLLKENEQLRHSMPSQNSQSRTEMEEIHAQQKNAATIQENENIKKELAHFQELQYIDQETIKSLKTEVEKLMKEAADSKDLISTLEQRLEETQAENDDLRKQISRTDDSMRRLFAESNTLASRVQQQQVTIVDLEEQLTKARARTPPSRGWRRENQIEPQEK